MGSLIPKLVNQRRGSNAIEKLLQKLDGSGSASEWSAVKQLREQPDCADLLLAHFRQSPRFGARSACVYHATRYASSPIALELGLLATGDKSKVVRYRAAMLLAVAQNSVAISHLEEMKQKFPVSSDDAAAAIFAIQQKNPNLYVDRENTGLVTLKVA